MKQTFNIINSIFKNLLTYVITCTCNNRIMLEIEKLFKGIIRIFFFKLIE